MTDSSSLHDPGGHSRFKVPDHIKSYGVFSDCGRYRWILKRTWNYQVPRLLVIGMNPSVADLVYDDPTVRKECVFAENWGYGGIVKCNVCDYRATDPKDLLALNLRIQTTGNLDTLRIAIASHQDILIAWGNLHPRISHLTDPVMEMLQPRRYTLWCLGKTKAGNPRHPLYLSLKTERQLFYERNPDEG